MKHINVITCTYQRNEFDRIVLLTHLKEILESQSDIRWIVVDDNDALSEDLSMFLPSFATHLFAGPSKDKGHLQRNAALEYIYDNDLDGLIYNADDDNKYNPIIFDKLRQTEKFSIVPVGNLGPNGIEKAILDNGKFIRWDSDILGRKYPVDMASFCFNTSLLKKLSKPFWPFKGFGGESEFIDKLIRSVDDIEFLAHDEESVYVWHNGLLK